MVKQSPTHLKCVRTQYATTCSLQLCQMTKLVALNHYGRLCNSTFSMYNTAYYTRVDKISLRSVSPEQQSTDRV